MEKAQRGGGGKTENQKVHNANCGLLWEEGGGGPDFQIFPKFKCMKYGFDFYNILVIYWWDIGKFGTNMVIYDWNYSNVALRYDVCTVLDRVQGNPKI